MANCVVCASTKLHQIDKWRQQCRQCDYESSTLKPALNDDALHDSYAEYTRESGLKQLRVNNFKRLIAQLKSLRSEGQLLEVGSAHGWFLDLIQKDYKVLGIEPDNRMFQQLKEKQLPVRHGFFPECLKEGESFDVIAFNDVFEHLPNIADVVDTCYRRLHPDGLLMINLPNSQGLLYKISKIFKKIGLGSFFERLWQKDLPSPHLHYFNPNNLSKLLKTHGFEVCKVGYLPVLNIKGLFPRIMTIKNSSRLLGIITYFLIVSSYPFIQLCKSDIFYLIAKK